MLSFEPETLDVYTEIIIIIIEAQLLIGWIGARKLEFNLP